MHITAYFSATRCSFNEPDGAENKVLDIQCLVKKESEKNHRGSQSYSAPCDGH